MNYEDALRAWGATRLSHYGEIDPATVTVSMDFSEGYACCGGRDPGCYCSFAESPRADVVIRGEYRSGAEGAWPPYTTIAMADFDFVAVLAEIVDAANGEVTDV